MQNTIAQKRKRNRDAKRETRESFREYTYTKLTMTPYAGFNALPPDTPELNLSQGLFSIKSVFQTLAAYSAAHVDRTKKN